MKSDKQHLLKSQEALIAEIFAGARNHLTHGDRFTFKVGINFTPNQHWIDRFAEIGFVFIPTPPSMQSGLTAFDIQYDRRLMSAAVSNEIEPELWEPVNGERIQASFPMAPRTELDWIDCNFIGMDGEYYVVSTGEMNYIAVTHIRPKPTVLEVDLGELLETYAKANNVDVHQLRVVQPVNA